MKFIKISLVFLLLSIFSLFFIQRVEASGDLTLNVVPQTGAVFLDNFPGGNLTLVIEKDGIEHTYNAESLPAGEVEIHAPMLNFIEIAPGDTVTATVGGDSISHVVLGNLAITNIDLVENTVTGIANTEGAGMVVEGDYEEGYVYVAVFDGGPVEELIVEADPGGWIAIFESGSLASGRMVVVMQADGTGGQTTYIDAESLESFFHSIIIDSISSFGNIVSNIQDILLEYPESYQELYFSASGLGSITFDNANIEELLNLEFSAMSALGQVEDFIYISFDEENNKISVSVNTTAFTFLQGSAATIEFMKVAERLGIDDLTEDNIREYLDIFVFDGGERVTDVSEYFDWENLSYDPVTDILTLPVNHFTEYVLGELDVQEEEVDAETLTETGMGIIAVTSLSVASLVGYTLLKKKEK